MIHMQPTRAAAAKVARRSWEDPVAKRRTLSNMNARKVRRLACFGPEMDSAPRSMPIASALSLSAAREVTEDVWGSLSLCSSLAVVLVEILGGMVLSRGAPLNHFQRI